MVQKTNTDAPTPCPEWLPDAGVKVRGLAGRALRVARLCPRSVLYKLWPRLESPKTPPCAFMLFYHFLQYKRARSASSRHTAVPPSLPFPFLTQNQRRSPPPPPTDRRPQSPPRCPPATDPLRILRREALPTPPPPRVSPSRGPGRPALLPRNTWAAEAPGGPDRTWGSQFWGRPPSASRSRAPPPAPGTKASLGEPLAAPAPPHSPLHPRRHGPRRRQP